MINGNLEAITVESGHPTAISRDGVLFKSKNSQGHYTSMIYPPAKKDKVVRLILAMKLSLEQCQAALKISGRAALYPKNKRDSILIYAIDRGLTITQCNALLSKYKECELK